jgi:trk system potassium uptake protein TrkH
LLGSTALFVLLEWDGILAEMPLATRPLAAFFHSVAARTAGFNTVEIASLTNASLFLTILLMLIGAGACSTAGGLKVSSVMVLVCQARAAFEGRARVSLFRRTLPSDTLQRASVTALLFLITTFVGLTLLLIIEQSSQPHRWSPNGFLDAFFEIASAIGTVGLSTGITQGLTDAGKTVIIALMFLGRLGPISVFAALSRSKREDRIEFPSESVLTG